MASLLILLVTVAVTSSAEAGVATHLRSRGIHGQKVMSETDDAIRESVSTVLPETVDLPTRPTNTTIVEMTPKVETRPSRAPGRHRQQLATSRRSRIKLQPNKKAKTNGRRRANARKHNVTVVLLRFGNATNENFTEINETFIALFERQLRQLQAHRIEEEQAKLLQVRLRQQQQRLRQQQQQQQQRNIQSRRRHRRHIQVDKAQDNSVLTRTSIDKHEALFKVFIKR